MRLALALTTPGLLLALAAPVLAAPMPAGLAPGITTPAAGAPTIIASPDAGSMSATRVARHRRPMRRHAARPLPGGSGVAPAL